MGSLVMSFVDHYKLPRPIRKRVLAYFRSVSVQKSAQSLSDLTAELSPDLLKELSTYLISHDIMYNSLFEGVPFNALIRVQGISEVIHVEANSIVADAGDAGTAMFLITGGMVQLETIEDSAATENMKTLYAGDSFGEEIITGVAESYLYNAMAITKATMYMIEEKAFKEAFEYLPDCFDAMALNVVISSKFALLYPEAALEAKLKMGTKQ